MEPKTEIELLRERATKLGIDFHPSIGADKLKAKIDEALSEDEDQAPIPTPAAVKTKLQLKKEAEKLVRIRVSCMNPNKKEWEGELFSVGNSAIGQFRKYVPFNNEDGWHVPQIIVNHLKERECQIFTTTKDSRGNKIRKGKMIKEFNLEILPALTPAELKDLAVKQAMANSID